MPDAFRVVMASNTPFYFSKTHGTGYEGVDLLVVAALGQALRKKYRKRLQLKSLKSLEASEVLFSEFASSFTTITSPEKSWGSCELGSCRGMIGMLQRNVSARKSPSCWSHFAVSLSSACASLPTLLQEFDFAMSGMSVSYDRHQHVDFSFPYLLDRLTFVVRAPRPLDPANAIIRPFSSEVRITFI